MTQFVLSPNTQNLINIALTNGPGANNINYFNAYNAISSDIQANGGVASGVASWFANAGSINTQQFSPNAVGAYVWNYTVAAAQSEGASVSTSQLQTASNTIASSVFQQLQSSGFQFNDQGNFSIQRIVADDAGAGIGYLQSLFPSANLDFAIWAGTLTARNGLGDSTYLSDYNLANNLWIGSRDCNAIISGMESGGAAAFAVSPSTALSNMRNLDGGVLWSCTETPNPAINPAPIPLTLNATESGGLFNVSFSTTNPSNGYQDSSSTSYNLSSRTWTDSTHTTNSSGTVVETGSLNNSSSGLTGTITEGASASQFSESTSVNAAGAETISTSGTGGGFIDASNATINQSAVLPRGGADFIVGNNDMVNVATGSFGKLGTPYSAVDDIAGSGLSLTGQVVTADVEASGTSFTVDSSYWSIVNGDNYTGLNVTVDGTPGSTNPGADSISGIGTGSTVNVNMSDETVTTATGDTIDFGGGTKSEVLNGSSDSVIEGNSADADIKGSNDSITLGNGDKVLANGSGDVISTGSGDVIDLASNETVTVDGSGDTIVGNTGDTIYVTGTSDRIFADSSNIEIEGADSGDIVYGVGDTGDTSDWGGYVNEGGGYGGYGGGGYYASVARGSQVKTSAPVASAGTDIAGLASFDYEREGSPHPAYSRAARAVSVTDAPVVGNSVAHLDPTAASYLSANTLAHAMSSWPGNQASALWTDTSPATALGQEAVLATPQLHSAHARAQLSGVRLL